MISSLAVAIGLKHKESIMNNERIEGSWKQLKLNIKQRWCKLTGYFLACNGEEIHGISKSQMNVWREHEKRNNHRK